MQAVSDISRVPPQLLAQVLQHVDPAHRLRSAAMVCKSWRLAAVMATSNIQLQLLPAKCASFSAWLQSNSALAAVSSINITCWGDHVDHTPQLELPAQQLQDLCSLSCSGLLVTAAGANSSAEGVSADSSAPPPPAPFLTPAFAALTRLELIYGAADLQGLETLTALQHLRLSSPGDAGVHNVNKLGTPAALAEALRQLRCLTFLGLTGPVCSNTVLQHLNCLQRLAVLNLAEVSCSASCFVQLPSSLQHVTIEFNDPEPVISPSSTPGFSQLTALVELSLSHAAAFDTGMLASLTCLTKLELSPTPLTAPDGQFRFKALADLKHPHLQSLALDQDVFEGAILTGTELAALVAPTGLRQLLLGTGHMFVEPEEYSLMFTADRHLPFLSKLAVGAGLLGNPAAVQHMAKGCPNLQQLSCMADVQDDPLEILPSQVTRSLASLTGLTALQKLEVCDRDLHLRQESYKAIATLTGLKHLNLEMRRAYNLYSVVALTACRQLESLRFTSVAVDPPFEVGDVVLQNQVGHGLAFICCCYPSVRLCSLWQSCWQA